MQKYLTEALGSFFLVIIIALAVDTSGQSAPLMIGLGLAALVFMGGWISGAHYNPAVTIAVAVRGALPWNQVAPYIASQAAGAVLAGLLASRVLDKSFIPKVQAGASLNMALTIEALFTFLLVLVILNVATVKRVANNHYYGIAIGFTVAVGAYCGGQISGAAFNPIVILGGYASTLGTFPLELLAYIAVQMVAALAAALVFKAQAGGNHALT